MNKYFISYLELFIVCFSYFAEYSLFSPLDLLAAVLTLLGAQGS